MAEAEKMADRVAILLRGKIVATRHAARAHGHRRPGSTKVSVRTEQSALLTDRR